MEKKSLRKSLNNYFTEIHGVGTEMHRERILWETTVVIIVEKPEW
jgi:hypothetical protein